MSANFSIEVDRKRDLVRITMAGFFTPEDVRAFTRARAKAHAELECGPNQHVTLNDVRAMKIQSQETVALFELMLAAPEYRSRRLAFVAAQTLVRGQLERVIADRDDARCFEDSATAEAWLIGGDRAASARRAAA